MGSPQAQIEPPIGVSQQPETIREKLTRSHRRFGVTRAVTLVFAVGVLVVIFLDSRTLRSDTLPTTLAAYEGLAELERADAALRGYLLSGDPHFRSDWEQLSGQGTGRVLGIAKGSFPSSASLNAAFQSLKSEQERWVRLRAEAPLSAEASSEALSMLDEAMKNVRLALVNIGQAGQTSLLEIVARSTTISVAIIALVVLVMFMTFFISSRVVRQIHKTVIEPVELLAESASQLAAGTLREDVPATSNDELGRLAKALNQLRVSLALAEMKYRSLFANTSNSMLLLDAQSLTITDANHSFEELMESKRRRLQDKNVLELFEQEQRPLLEEGLKKAQAHGQHTVSGLFVTTPSRLMVVLDVRITSVQVSTEKVVELTFVDVTEQYVKNQALSEIAFKDELTGLFNHRSFYQYLKEEVARAEHENALLILLFVDLDNFKQCNDTFGHQVGDQLLRNVGQLVREHIRQNRDRGFRYGGDEFAVLLPEASVNVAERIANQVREGFDSIEQFGTSMSIGVAAWKAGMDGEALVKAADGALYAAKSAGKNTVRISS